MKFYTEYKKDMNHQYLIISLPTEIEQYSLRMLLENQIFGILTLELKIVDNKKCYYYDITSKQSILNLLEKESINEEKIRLIIKQIIQIIEQTQEYLLLEDEFILNPEYIYLDSKDLQINLCYLPGYNVPIKQQFCELIEYFMNQIDYKDKETVLFIYELYQVSRQEDCTFKKIYNIIEEKEISIIKEEPKQMLPAQSPIFIEEKIDNEVKTQKYSIKTILKSIFSVLFCFIAFITIQRFGILEEAGKPDLIKALFAILVIVNIEAFLLNKFWSKDNKKIEKKDFIPIDKIKEKIVERKAEILSEEQIEVLSKSSNFDK